MTVGNYDETRLVQGMTANGDYPSGRYLTLGDDTDIATQAIAIYGTFDTATVEFVFFTEDDTNTLVEMPISADFTFTAAPEPQQFRFPLNMPFKIRLSSVGASTNLGVNLHQLPS